jgi:hypothetical protein
VAVARHPDVMLAPRQVRDWIGGLPLANPPRAAQMLLQQLRLLVRDPNPGSRLGQLLEIYEPPLGQLLPFAHERMLSNPDLATPLDQFEYLLVELLTELACGHLRVANETLAAGKAPATETLYRAMHLLDNANNIERLHYHHLAPDHWRLALSIFLRAEEQQAGDHRVSVALRQEDEPDTVRGLFFRALIISLCDPHSRRPGEVLNWLHWIGQHTLTLQFTVLPQGAFAVPVDIGGSQSPLAAARRGKPGPAMRYLAIDGFLQQLQEDANAPQGLRSALNDVIKGRKTPEQRHSARQPRNHPYRLLSGLGEIHRRLGELAQGAEAAAIEATFVPCLQVNQSNSGAAFHLQGPLSTPLSVGETILAEAESRASGGAPIGFAARIQRLVNDENRIEIGVAKLLGRLIPVSITGAAAERRRGDNQALLLHAADSGKYLLLASRSIFREGDTVAVEGPNVRYSLRMLGLDSVVQGMAYIEVETIG